MVRKLKIHEQKLLKKVDFVNWETNNVKEIAIMRKYNINRKEYTEYNKLTREIRVLADKINSLPDSDPFRLKMSAELTEQLYTTGLIKTRRLRKGKEISLKAFCRRRLPVFMVQSGMFNGPISIATRYVQHGHVRIGPHTVTDPAFIVTRTHEDLLTWTSEFKKKIDSYNDQHDDYID